MTPAEIDSLVLKLRQHTPLDRLPRTAGCEMNRPHHRFRPHSPTKLNQRLRVLPSTRPMRDGDALDRASARLQN